MKKSLLAVAAMTAFAGAAQAQSSVTVYGILDVGYVGSSYKGTSGTANAVSSGNSSTIGSATTNATSNAIGQSAESTSRIGFKGTEDLGGGTSALFTVEVGLNPNGATSFATFNRQAFVGLKKNGLGTVAAGTQYTPLFDVQSITDAAGNNNLVGNAIYSGSLQSSTGTFDNGLGAYNGQYNAATVNAGLTAQNSAYVTRSSNAVKFQSDRFAGVAAQVFYAQNNSSSTQYSVNYAGGTTVNAGGGVANNTVVGANVDYIWNKLQVVAAYQQFKAYDPAFGTAGTVLLTTIANGTAGSMGYNDTDAQTYGAATYDFGILKGYAQYINRKITSNIDSSYTATRQAYQLGVKSQLTPVISTYVTAGMGNSALFGQSVPKQNFRTFQIGTDYNLSKRTNLYVAYGSFNQSSSGAVGAGAATTTLGAAATPTSGANYAAGIRHTF